MNEGKLQKIVQKENEEKRRREKEKGKRLENKTIDTGMNFCKTHYLKERKKKNRPRQKKRG